MLCVHTGSCRQSFLTFNTEHIRNIYTFLKIWSLSQLNLVYTIDMILLNGEIMTAEKLFRKKIGLAEKRKTTTRKSKKINLDCSVESYHNIFVTGAMPVQHNCRKSIYFFYFLFYLINAFKVAESTKRVYKQFFIKNHSNSISI